MKKLIFKFNISDEAFELLKDIQTKGQVEYRDIEFERLQDFINAKKTAEYQTEDYFLKRNNGGTFYLITELCKYDLVDLVDDTWHHTYELTLLGKEILKQNK